jgi:hypothetical protein
MQTELNLEKRLFSVQRENSKDYLLTITVGERNEMY